MVARSTSRNEVFAMYAPVIITASDLKIPIRSVYFGGNTAHRDEERRNESWEARAHSPPSKEVSTHTGPCLALSDDRNGLVTQPMLPILVIRHSLDHSMWQSCLPQNQIRSEAMAYCAAFITRPRLSSFVFFPSPLRPPNHPLARASLEFFHL
ncbi:hypothetical protein MRB53_042004 [Persea americana]|nr:hypothetical protein MRB53_042004 [Persea americana]